MVRIVVVWFLVCVIGFLLLIPLHLLSLEHQKLWRKYGKKRGTKIGNIYGLISGWGFFLFLIGIWVSPQPRFIIPIFQNLSTSIPVIDFSIPLLHLIIFISLIILAAWLAISGVKKVTLKVAETHRTERIVTAGVYSAVRHPQYLGAVLAHVGVSFLLSAWYSLLFTPIIAGVVYLISWKEEKELVREFGREYKSYQKKVPMFIPRFRKK